MCKCPIAKVKCPLVSDNWCDSTFMFEEIERCPTPKKRLEEIKELEEERKVNKAMSALKRKANHAR